MELFHELYTIQHSADFKVSSPRSVREAEPEDLLCRRCRSPHPDLPGNPFCFGLFVNVTDGVIWGSSRVSGLLLFLVPLLENIVC